jgi:hypothetical protein
MIVYGSTCSSVRLSSSKTQFQLPGIHVVNHKLGHDMTRYRTFKISKHTLSMKCEMKLHIHTYYINEASNIYMYVCTYIYTYMYHVVCSTHICRYQIIHVTWYIHIHTCIVCICIPDHTHVPCIPAEGYQVHVYVLYNQLFKEPFFSYINLHVLTSHILYVKQVPGTCGVIKSR